MRARRGFVVTVERVEDLERPSNSRRCVAVLGNDRPAAGSTHANKASGIASMPEPDAPVQLEGVNGGVVPAAYSLA